MVFRHTELITVRGFLAMFVWLRELCVNCYHQGRISSGFDLTFGVVIHIMIFISDDIYHPRFTLGIFAFGLVLLSLFLGAQPDLKSYAMDNDGRITQFDKIRVRTETFVDHSIGLDSKSANFKIINISLCNECWFSGLALCSSVLCTRVVYCSRNINILHSWSLL